MQFKNEDLGEELMMLPCVVRLPPLSLIRARLTVARPANRTDMALIEDPKFSPWVKKCASSWFSRHVLSTLHSPDPVSRSRRRRGPRGVLRRLCQGAPCSLHVTVPARADPDPLLLSRAQVFAKLIELGVERNDSVRCPLPPCVPRSWL